jgi:hypothetical protein
MESRSNSTENDVALDEFNHDLAFAIVAMILTIITISIFCTLYKISVGEEPNFQIQLKQIKEPRIT